MQLPVWGIAPLGTWVHTLNVDTETTQINISQEKDAVVKRTSLNLPTELWDELRIAAIRRQMTATEAVELAIRSWVTGSAA